MVGGKSRTSYFHDTPHGQQLYPIPPYTPVPWSRWPAAAPPRRPRTKILRRQLHTNRNRESARVVYVCTPVRGFVCGSITRSTVSGNFFFHSCVSVCVQYVLESHIRIQFHGVRRPESWSYSSLPQRSIGYRTSSGRDCTPSS